MSSLNILFASNFHKKTIFVVRLHVANINSDFSSDLKSVSRGWI